MESIGYIFDINLVIRVLSALLLGFAIGLEREMTNKYAGLRTVSYTHLTLPTN